MCRREYVGSLYTIKLKSACREPDLSLSGLDPVPLSKIGTHLPPWVAKEKIATLLLASEMLVPIPPSRCSYCMDKGDTIANANHQSLKFEKSCYKRKKNKTYLRLKNGKAN